MASAEERPIRLVVRDDLERSRATVFFRLFLAVPLVVWVLLRGIAALVVGVASWLAVLVQGEVPAGMHGFTASYLRYATQVSAYVLLAANPYPWFRAQPLYPVDLELDPPVRQGRWGGLFRLVLALPALVLAAALGGGFATGSAGRGSVTAVAAFLAWFAIVGRGRAPRGLRDLVAYTLGYAAHAGGYVLLLTPRYPSSDPALAERYADLPEHPVRIVVTDDLARPRLTVLFRGLLGIPHLLWWGIWAAAVVVAAPAACLLVLALGRMPRPLHRFLAAFVRYSTHLFAFVHVVGRRFPGFTGRAGSYGVDLEIDGPARQRRWKSLVRFGLVLPALLLASALGVVAIVVAVLAWWYALATARMPEGLRNLGASCLRYAAQTAGYLLFLTDRYPYAAPVLRARPPEPAPATPLVGDAF